MRPVRIIRALVVFLALVAWTTSSAHALPARAAASPSEELQPACRAPAMAARLHSAAVHRAGLVVTFGGGMPTNTFCIEFTEDTISGLQLLQRSGLALVTSGGGLGAAVCAIDGVGSMDASSYSACFGEYPDYWAYYQYVAGGWRMSAVGASSSVVSDGSIEGWAWGKSAKPDPPGTICPSPSATPAVTPTTITQESPSVTPLPSMAPSPPSAPTVPPATTAEPPMSATPGQEASPQKEPVQDASPGSNASADAAPTQTAEDAVQGLDHPAAPATATTPAPFTPEGAPPVTPQAVPSRTPRSGAIVVDPDQGKQNAASAERGVQSGGGGTWALIGFGAVAVSLIILGAILLMRRRAVG